jgi:hypothetical protein
LYLDCIDVATRKPTRLVLPSKFPVLLRDLLSTLSRWPELKEQPATLLTYTPVRVAEGKQVLAEQRIVSDSFEKVVEWVRGRILKKEEAIHHLMQSLAQLANHSNWKMITVTLLDEEEDQKGTRLPVSGGFTLKFVPDDELPVSALRQHYSAVSGHAEEFREGVEKTRKCSLTPGRIVKPGDAGFTMPRRGRR